MPDGGASQPNGPQTPIQEGNREVSAYRTLLTEVVRGVATITLNRPRQRNAVGDGMREELTDAYRVCDRDDAIRFFVLTGTPPAFCAGADLGAGDRTFAAPGPGFSAAASTCPRGRSPSR
jgi:enoyl-CoA hydratase/carnithine racemase